MVVNVKLRENSFIIDSSWIKAKKIIIQSNPIHFNHYLGKMKIGIISKKRRLHV